MTLSECLTENLRAGFSGIWIRSFEHEDALSDIAKLCHDQDWGLSTWDIDQGVHGTHASTDQPVVSDPLSAVRSLSQLGSDDKPSVLVLSNFHRFLGSAEVVQAVTRQIVEGKSRLNFLVILSPVVHIPTELEKLIVVVEHDLPDRAQLNEIATSIASEEGELPEGEQLDRVLDAASGLTRYEAEGAFSLSLVRHSRLEPSAISEIKSQALIKSGLLTLHQGTETFADLGGLDSLKSFCKQAMCQKSKRAGKPKARGVMLLGVPGTGKSAFCKALGNESGRPTLALDVGALMGSLIGQTEERTRQALSIVDAMQPAVLFIDEVEKAFGGASGNGNADSGVGSRMFGALLTWLNDHQSDVFVVCTANDVTKLPPEFCRAERFDGLFFLDLPSQSQKQAIWQQYLRAFALDVAQELPDDRNWTGAEVKSCCRLAALLDVSLIDAARNVVPIANTAAESIAGLREWAGGRCLSADTAGIYENAKRRERRQRRRVSRDPSNN